MGVNECTAWRGDQEMVLRRPRRDQQDIPGLIMVVRGGKVAPVGSVQKVVDRAVAQGVGMRDRDMQTGG